jgi:hypothetical protein
MIDYVSICCADTCHEHPFRAHHSSTSIRCMISHHNCAHELFTYQRFMHVNHLNTLSRAHFIAVTLSYHNSTFANISLSSIPITCSRVTSVVQLLIRASVVCKVLLRGRCLHVCPRTGNVPAQHRNNPHIYSTQLFTYPTPVYPKEV